MALSAPIINAMKTFLRILALLLCIPALPALGAERQSMATVRKSVQSWLDQALANSPGTPAYKIGEIDSRLRLDACQDMQMSLPMGYRLLGKTMVRVQCISGASWSFSIPVQISINVTYYAAARPLASGQEVREGDLTPQQGDLAALPGSVVLDPARAIGRTLNSPIAAGNPLRQEMLRSQIVIRQHQKVRIFFRSAGIEVMNEGTALGNAMEGQPVRVKVSNGQTVQGTARADGSVDTGQ